MTRTVTVGLRLNAQGFHSEAGRAEADVSRINRQLTGLGRHRGFQQATGGAHTLRNALTGIVGGAAGAGLVKLVVDSTRAAASYETTLRQVAVASGVTGKAAAQVTGAMDALAIKLGKDTVFSAQDAADAMLELAKGGLNATQIQAGAAASTLTLATAGGLGLANAAGYIVQGLTSFNLTAKESASVAAALAGGANASTASVEDMGLALSQVGPGAVAAGLSLQETTGVLAGFANNGIKGSDAGTSLKTMLARLVPQTEKAKGEMHKLGLSFVDAHGSFLPIADVAEQLHTKLGKLSEAERTHALNVIFGSDASRAAYVLMKEGKKGVEDLTKATSDQTAAAQMSKATTSGLAGSLSQLSGSVDTAKLQLGRALAPLISDLADHTTEWANTITDKAIPKLERFIRGMENGTGPGGEFADTLSEIGDAVQGAWHVAEPMFSYIGGHPHLFATVAKDAAALAVAMKVIGAVKALPALGGLGGGLGRVGGTVASKASPVPVFVTNPGFGTGGGGGAGAGAGAGGGKALAPLIPVALAVNAHVDTKDLENRLRNDPKIAKSLHLTAAISPVVDRQKQAEAAARLADTLADPRIARRTAIAAQTFGRQWASAGTNAGTQASTNLASLLTGGVVSHMHGTSAALSAALLGPLRSAHMSVQQLDRELADLPRSVVIGVQISTGQTSLRAAETQLGIPHKADGGLLSGPGSGTSDSMLLRASNGEFVVNAKATSRNLPLLKALNDGAPGFAAGGHVITSYNPRAGSVSRQASYVRRQGGTVDDVNALMASWDAYLTHLDQVKQRTQLVSAIVHASSAADRAQAQRDLRDFDAQTRIDRERAAVDKLTAAMQKAADVETHRREIMDNRYKLGLVSGKAEAADLDRRMAKVEKYSDAWMQLNDQKQQILGDERQKQLDTVTFRYPYAGQPMVMSPARGAGAGGSSSTSYDQRTSASIVVQKDSTAKEIVRELAWVRR